MFIHSFKIWRNLCTLFFRLKYLKNEIFETEDEILSALNFEVLTVYPISFLKKFCLYDLDDLDNKEKSDMELCYNGAQFFMEICLIEPKFCELKPSLQAAICLYLSRKFLRQYVYIYLGNFFYLKMGMVKYGIMI